MHKPTRLRRGGANNQTGCICVRDAHSHRICIWNICISVERVERFLMMRCATNGKQRPLIIFIIISHSACAALWLWRINIHFEDSGSRVVPPSLRFLDLHFGEVLLFCLWVCPLPYLLKGCAEVWTVVREDRNESCWFSWTEEGKGLAIYTQISIHK